MKFLNIKNQMYFIFRKEISAINCFPQSTEWVDFSRSKAMDIRILSYRVGMIF